MFLQQGHKSRQVGPTTVSQESCPPPSPQMSPVVSLILNHWRIAEKLVLQIMSPWQPNHLVNQLLYHSDIGKNSLRC